MSCRGKGRSQFQTTARTMSNGAARRVLVSRDRLHRCSLNTLEIRGLRFVGLLPGITIASMIRVSRPQWTGGMLLR